MSDQAWCVAVEIGGTKLQWGVGEPGQPWKVLERREVRPAAGAAGIREELAAGIRELQGRFRIGHVGIGFGGPVARSRGATVTSHQIRGWDDFPLVAWCREQFNVSATIANDCDAAALAEARLGAGRGARSVFYVTIGSGIGGGFVVDGQLFGRDRPAIAEIGHLRPGKQAVDSRQTVESVASGWGITRQVQARLAHPLASASTRDHDDLMERCHGRPAQLDTKMIAEAARAGNGLARQAIADSIETLGWAMAQTMTLLAPEVFVIGGGVSMMPHEQYLDPLRDCIRRFTFPLLADHVELRPAELGEEVVLHGALLLASEGG